jgi:ABC-type glycerol-3-phosphate transport system permease component
MDARRPPRQRFGRGRPARRLRRLARYLAICLLLAYALLPFYWMLIGAVRPAEEFLRVPPLWVPRGISLRSFVEVWSAVPLATYMLNSAIVAGVTTIVAVGISSIAGYAIFRYDFAGRSLLLVFVLFTQTVPAVVILLPLYVLLSDADLLNTRVGLALSYTVWSVPFGTLLLRSYFVTAYPVEVEEAALIDGCSRASVLWRIMLPLSLPGLITAGIFTSLLAWNEFIWASVITTSEDIRPVSVGLQQFVGFLSANEDLGLWMAGAVLSTLPVMVVFIAVQRYVAAGFGFGGLVEK